MRTPRRWDQWNRAVVLAALGLSSTSFAALDATGAAGIVLKGSPPSVAACSSCHGPSGEGNAAAGFPRLAGLGAAYLGAQLDSFASNARPNPVMGPIAKALTPAQRQGLASYYASLHTKFSRVAVDDTAIRPANVGAWLANRGRWNDGLPACIGCHGSGGAGVAPTFPPLAGQPASYLSAQLNDWKAGKREPGPQALMAQVAAKLSASDINNVSEYFGALQPTSLAGSSPQKGLSK